MGIFEVELEAAMPMCQKKIIYQRYQIHQHHQIHQLHYIHQRHQIHHSHLVLSTEGNRDQKLSPYSLKSHIHLLEDKEKISTDGG